MKVRHALFTCACGARLDGAAGLGHDEGLDDPARCFSMCFYCAQPFGFDAALRPRRLSPREEEALFSDPQFVRAWAAVMIVAKERSGLWMLRVLLTGLA